MIVIDKILKITSDITDFIKNNPKFFLGVIFMLIVSMLFKQCETNRNLKKEIKKQETINENDRIRHISNVEVLTGKVEMLNNETTYIKGILRVKEGELAHLDVNLQMAKEEVERLLKENKKKGTIRNIYITQISSEITTNDVITNVGTDSMGNTYIGISDSNQIYSLSTKSWFKLEPNGDRMNLKLVDKYGVDKSSQLKHSLNFSLSLSQIEMDSSTKVIVQVKDKNGNNIPKDILHIPFINGVDFIDVKSKEKEVPVVPEPIKRFGIMAGLSSGLFNVGNNFQPGWGLGIMLGFKLF